MKKLLGIVVLVLLLSGSLFAENLGIDKTVNDYVDNDYTIVSVEIFEKINLAYTLRSNAKTKPLIVTCIYSPKDQTTICFKP